MTGIFLIATEIDIVYHEEKGGILMKTVLSENVMVLARLTEDSLGLFS